MPLLPPNRPRAILLGDNPLDPTFPEAPPPLLVALATWLSSAAMSASFYSQHKSRILAVMPEYVDLWLLTGPAGTEGAGVVGGPVEKSRTYLQRSAYMGHLKAVIRQPWLLLSCGVPMH